MWVNTYSPAQVAVDHEMFTLQQQHGGGGGGGGMKEQGSGEILTA